VGKKFVRKLKATVLQSLVKIRLDDAVALLRTGVQERRNGAQYLAGYAVECSLKARICADQNTEHLDQKYYLHDLQDLAEKTQAWDKIKSDSRVFEMLIYLDEQWSVACRYQRQVYDSAAVNQYINRAKEFHAWLLRN